MPGLTRHLDPRSGSGMTIVSSGMTGVLMSGMKGMMGVRVRVVLGFGLLILIELNG